MTNNCRQDLTTVKPWPTLLTTAAEIWPTGVTIRPTSLTTAVRIGPTLTARAVNTQYPTTKITKKLQSSSDQSYWQVVSRSGQHHWHLLSGSLLHSRPDWHHWQARQEMVNITVRQGLASVTDNCCRDLANLTDNYCQITDPYPCLSRSASFWLHPVQYSLHGIFYHSITNNGCHDWPILLATTVKTDQCC